MDDGAYIGFVDSHAEGNGGHDDLQLTGQELPLCLFAHLGWKAGVVRSGREVSGELLRESLGVSPGGGVDNRWASYCIVEKPPSRGESLVLGCFHHLNGEIVPPEAMDEACRLLQTKLSDDIFLYLQRRRRG